jgi:Saxitoxin biosynthesis operon protein SxtJ
MMATVLEPKIERAPAPEGSDRGFGFVFAAVFSLIGCWPLLSLQPPRWWALAIAAAFAIVAFIRPQILHPLNQLWLMLGRLLHRIVSPLVMGVIFFTVVTPTGWLMRLRGKDVLSLRRRPDLTTYWIERGASRPESEAMKNQF